MTVDKPREKAGNWDIKQAGAVNDGWGEVIHQPARMSFLFLNNINTQSSTALHPLEKLIH